MKKSSVILTLGSVSGGGMIKCYSEGFNAAVEKKLERFDLDFYNVLFNSFGENFSAAGNSWKNTSEILPG